MANLQLFLVPGDPLSVAVAAYLHFSHLDFVPVHATNNTVVLLVNNSLLEGYDNIVKHLKHLGHDLNWDLSPIQRAESFACISTIKHHLHDALLDSFYLTPNYSSIRSTLFHPHLPWISKFTFPNQIQSAAKQRLENKYPSADRNSPKVPEIWKSVILCSTDTEVNEVYLHAHDVLKSISRRMADKKYYFGEKPTEVDAVLYGYLSLYNTTTIPNPRLYAILSFEFSNLVHFTNFIRVTWFPPNNSAPKPVSSKVISNSKGKGVIKRSFDEFLVGLRSLGKVRGVRVGELVWSETTGKVLGVVVAVGFFVGYVVRNQIVQVV